MTPSRAYGRRAAGLPPYPGHARRHSAAAPGVSRQPEGRLRDGTRATGVRAAGAVSRRGIAASCCPCSSGCGEAAALPAVRAALQHSKVRSRTLLRL